MQRLTSSLVGLCLVAFFLGVALAKADEEKVPLDKLPKAVLDAVKARFPKAKLLEASKEIEDGKTVYEISLTNKDQHIDVSLTPEGKIIGLEKEIAFKTLPESVAKTLETKYPKATYKLTEEVFKVTEGKEKLEYYEMLLVTAENQTFEVLVAPDGKFLKETKKSKEKEDKK